MRYWMLPEDVIELLPEQAEHVERLRREALDIMRMWGYQLVMPPLVEFLDSLLAGSGEGLEEQTYKITDSQSARLMGVRADITPQIARIDAHRLPSEDISRFAYCGEVLRQRSESTEPRRNPLILGAELYGATNISADVEIMALMLDICAKAGLQNTVIDMGHAGIYSALVDHHQLNGRMQSLLHEVLAGKKRPDLREWQHNYQLSDQFVSDVDFLIDAHLLTDPLDDCKAQFSGRTAQLDQALSDLSQAQKQLKHYFPEQQITIDLTSIGSYGYHTGLLFALYVPGYFDAIARGGRYDNVGQAYGRARPATGFSADLLTLAQLVSIHQSTTNKQSVPPPKNNEAFVNIEQQRQQGCIIHFEHEE